MSNLTDWDLRRGCRHPAEFCHQLESELARCNGPIKRVAHAANAHSRPVDALLAVPLLHYVSRQHGKYVGARVVSRQVPATPLLRCNEVFIWRCRSVFPAVSRLISRLAGLRCIRMGQSDDIEDSMYGRHQDLCQKLNMDATAASEAWKSYETIRQNYTLEVIFILR